MSRRVPVTRYDVEHEASARAKGDRIRGKPATTARLHRWLTSGYELEAPTRLHDRDIADDGAPDHTPEAKRYLGFTQQREPNDWRAVACKTDADGFYVTPMRCAIARVGDPPHRALAGGLACNLLTPLDVTRAFGIPDDFAYDSIARSLDMVWASYADRPIPRRSSRSDAQLDAEAAA